MADMNTQETQIMTQEITITPDAVSEIRKIRAANQIPETHALRMGVKSGGCCGISYMLAFDEKAGETDKVIQTEGMTVFVDAVSLPQLAGTTLEFVNGPHGSGFKFTNPNDQQSCNCDDGCCG
jgi:iron-sulfur cluster assembly protein